MAGRVRDGPVDCQQRLVHLTHDAVRLGQPAEEKAADEFGACGMPGRQGGADQRDGFLRLVCGTQPGLRHPQLHGAGTQPVGKAVAL